LNKLKDQNAELIKQNDTLKKRYNDDVENMKQMTEDERN